jgi:oligopeptide transport system substrate-binding protein
VKFVLRGGQIPGTVFTPPGTSGYYPTSNIPKDGSGITEAKKLMKEAGFPDGKGFPKIEVHYNTHDGHKKIAEALHQMWKEALGIDITLYNQEWKVYLDNQRTKNYQLSRMGWIADYNDPNTFLDLLVTDGGNNRTGWSNKKYDKLIADAALEQNAKKRLAIFQKAENILLDEMPVLPIYIYTRYYLKSANVLGWHPNIEDIHPLKYVSIKE